ncbi:hypothetical protein CI610_00424 [invertebrate metagenome]|uniref:V-type ATP synthase subunit I n=1 Tax=invertebrate metagenome TaxID=1711999 RepID=A0A2H9TBI3_9ZZZZ
MAITRLKKITLYGPEQDKQLILLGLQKLGCIHLIPLKESVPEMAIQAQPAETSEALTWLERSPQKRRQVRNKDGIKTDDVVHKVLQNKTLFRETSDQRDQLEQRIREVRPWGEFSFPELSDLNGQRLWFYVVPNKHIDLLETLELPWEIIHQGQERSNVIVISKDEPPEDLLPVARSKVGKHSLSSLESEFEQAEQQLEDILAERESLTRWTYLLSQSMAATQDTASLRQAFNSSQDEDQFFLIQGWVPQDKQTTVEDYVQTQQIAAFIQEPESGDNPPTLLDEPDSTGGGGEAMAFFQLPNYRAWDPGNIVFYSFALFFAMIMSDAAYSALFGLILWCFRKKIDSTTAGKRLLNMGLFMSGLGIIWGILIGSYFGVSPTKDALLDSIAFINLNDYAAMMKLSVGIGVIHLVIANLASAWVNRDRLYALAPLGWAVLMIGGLTLWLGIMGSLQPVWKTLFGPGMMIVGALMIFLFTSTRPIHKISDLFLRILDGLNAVYKITGAFGDVLSYMRLFALGLSGASLAMTFNNLAIDVLHAMPVLGVLFAGLILLLGHLLNFALCLMSGVVHGMRLNVIEFFNWGLSDEGYPFKAFSKQED